MASLLLAVIYVAFISLGLPDSLLGSAWPTMSQDLNVPVAWAGGISAVISMFTIVSALLSDRMTLKFGAGKVTAVSVALTAAALAGFSVTRITGCCWPSPYHTALARAEWMRRSITT